MFDFIIFLLLICEEPRAFRQRSAVESKRSGGSFVFGVCSLIACRHNSGGRPAGRRPSPAPLVGAVVPQRH